MGNKQFSTDDFDEAVLFDSEFDIESFIASDRERDRRRHWTRHRRGLWRDDQVVSADYDEWDDFDD
ncbi:MAG: hypothetical protein HKO55_01485 [Gammaproteobacteria bacterium]|nr:hypothetical protein [Gammaproteobacteria bacterium]